MGMMRNHRAIFGGLLGLTAAALLSGCGWFDGGSSAVPAPGARPGADRQAPVVNALPPPSGSNPYESGVGPADEMRGAQGGPAIGSILSGKGGQKAQKEEAEKAAAEQSKKAREGRERANREAGTRKAEPPGEPPAGGALPAGAPPAGPQPAGPQPAATQPAAPPPAETPSAAPAPAAPAPAETPAAVPPPAAQPPAPSER